MNATVLHGDCREVLKTLGADSFDAVCTDPPYHLTSIVKRFSATSVSDNTQTSERSRNRSDHYARLATGFMGKTWDGGGVAFDPDTWRAVWRVLKPGGHMIVFGGTRTQHRMVCAIEDAGFEIRESLCWLYASGFPKSHNLHGDWEGYGTALKPAHEPIALCRKPLSERTIAANVLRHGCGALNIDGCRVATDEVITNHARGATSAISKGIYGDSNAQKTHQTNGQSIGRWPANLCHDGSPEVLAAFAAFGERLGAVSNGGRGIGLQGTSTFAIHDRPQVPGYADSGSAARFYFSAKADASDRAGSRHPTVKPVDLLRWLVRLITPPGGHCLDSFAGSGTTGEACMLEGFDCTLIEQDATHVQDILHRQARWHGGDLPLFHAPVPEPPEDARTADMFAEPESGT